MNLSRRTLISGMAAASIPATPPPASRVSNERIAVGNNANNSDNSFTYSVALDATGQIDIVTSAISSIRIPEPITAFMTLGNIEAGDGGHCLLHRVQQPSAPKPWHFKDASGAWFTISENQSIYPEIFGAKADPKADDWQAFKTALEFSNCLRLRGRNYYISRGLPIKRFQSIVSDGGPVNSNAGETSMPAGARLIFTGSGEACFYNDDPSQLISHGGMYGLTIKVVGDYNWIWDFCECVSWRWHNIEATVDASRPNVGILRSRKILKTNPSWLNQIINCNFILPNGSVGTPMDQDWSDSIIDGSSLSGGQGSIEHSYGNKYTNNNFERATNGAGLTLRKQERNAGSIFSNNYFDANFPYGLVIDVDDDPNIDNFSIHHVITGNKFRTVHSLTGEHGIADIYLKSHPTRSYRGGVFFLNMHGVSAVNPLLFDHSKWTNVVSGPVRSQYSNFAVFDYNKLDTTVYSGYKGINIPAGIACVRGSFTQYGMPNVAGHFGGNTFNPAGIQLGAINGMQPFIGASRRIDGTPTDLLIFTDATERLRLHSNGLYFRPATDNTMSLGSGGKRLTQLFSTTPTINTSDEREKENIQAIPDAVLDAWSEIKWVQFRFKDALMAKGDEARIHTGLIAQQILEVFQSRGLDPMKYGLLCYDEWEAQYEPVMDTKLNEAGDAVPYDTGKKRQTVAAGNRYGVRYEEAYAIEAAFQRKRIEKLEARVADITIRLQ